MSEADDGTRAYGCVFCVTGKEEAVAQFIERVCVDVRAIVPRQLKHKTMQGKSLTVEKTLYPGYVFFEAHADHEMISRLYRDKNIVSVLKAESGDWRLYGADARLVRWLFSYDGLLPLSQAYKEGDWVRVVAGPLLDYQAQITHFDKRRKSAQIAISFCGRDIKTWLHFELIELLEASQIPSNVGERNDL